MLNCKFIYQDKIYSRYQIGKLIRENKLYSKSDPDAAFKWLNDTLGLTRDQVSVVKGLIDGKSFGRVLSDGKILLSDQMIEGTEQHEAFHRVFNFFLDASERQDILNEFKQRSNYGSLLDNKKTEYPELSEDELIEEYLADEFAMYALNKGDYIIPGTKAKNFFEWLYNFFKNLFSNRISIKDLYNKINEGNFKGKPQKVYKISKAKNLLKVGDNIISPDKKNELFSALQVKLLSKIFKQNLIYDFIGDKIDITPYLVNSIQESISELPEGQDELYNNIFDDVYLENSLNPNSNFVNEFSKYLSTLGITTKTEIVSALDIEDEITPEDRESSEEESEIAKDYSFMKVSFEFDPKTNMSKAIKLLLASLEDTDKSKILNITKAVKVSDVSTLLFNSLANLPQDLDIYIDKLTFLSKDHPYLKEVIEYIKPLTDTTNVDYNFLKFRNEFIQTFTKTLYDFQIGVVKKGDIYTIPAISNNTARKTLTELSNYITINYKNSKELLDILDVPKITFEQISKALGFNLDNNDKNQELPDGKSVESKVFLIKNVLVDSIKAGTEIQNLYSEIKDQNLNIRPAIKLISQYIAESKIADLNFQNAEGKKMWAISLNNYQTIILNHLNWIGSKDISLDEKLELVKKYVPNILSKDNYRDGKIRSIWLNRILNNHPLQIGVYDGVTGHKKQSFSNLKETDLFSFAINQPFEGIVQSIKHSSRSTIFTYKFADKYIYVKNPDYNVLLDNSLTYLKDYLEDELYAIKQHKEGIGKQWRNYSKNGDKLQNFSFLNTHPKLKSAIESGDVTELLPAVRDYLIKKIDKFGSSAEKYGVFKDVDNRPAGISESMWKYFHEGNKKNKANAVKASTAFAYINSMISHIEEQKLFTGSTAFYKNLEDEYKRLSVQSSTGEIMVNDDYNNMYIQTINEKDSKTIYNPQTQQTEEFVYSKPSGHYSEIITEEYDEYVSDLTEIKEGIYSPINLQKTSTLRFIYETNLIKDLKPFLLQKGFTEDQANKIIQDKAEVYEKNYKNINENDGQSHMTIFAYREYEHRAGKWTKEKENNFQLQLKALNLASKEELKDLKIYVYPVRDKNGKLLESIVKTEQVSDEYIEVKPFDFNDVQEKLNENGYKWFKSTFTPFTPLKGQYVGGVFQEVGNIDLNVPGIRKTSYMPLQPTMIVGTNLQKLNALMIKGGKDLHHFRSSAKTGTLTESIQFYNNSGEFNYDGIAESTPTFLPVQYMKDQLKISSKNKDEIKNSTQSAKIILSNLMSGGYPKDIPQELKGTFDNSSEDTKEELSDFYRIISEYKSVLNSLIKDNINALKNELEIVTNDGGDTYIVKNFKKFVNVLEQSAEDRGSPIAILEAIEKFSESKIIETLPNKSKVENILFSLVTNRVINFKRPGDAKTQVAITGFESENRIKIGENLSNSKVLKFYEPVIKDNKIIKVNPAQIALPLPDKWIDLLLQRYNTNNLQDAIEQYNTDSNKFVVKGLRIPNQQLSSNDVFEIKEFYLPLVESFVLVPTEIVVKSGSDFDIDKLQLYYPEQDKTEYNKLLDIEIQILLHPDNLHNLLKPLVDDELKINVQNKIKSLTTLEAKLEPSDITDTTTNIDKFIQFIETKAGVGPLALSITAHSVAQIDNVNISNTIYVGKDKKGNPITKSTKVPFEGDYGNNLGRFFDEKGFDIIESLSIGLTSQVDGEKNPYARLLGISNQTLGVLSYLLRRGVSFETIIMFLKQPVIDGYLTAQRINESQVIESNSLQKKKRQDLIDSYIAENKLSKSEFTVALDKLQSGNLVISNEELSNNINKNIKDAKGLATFIYLVDVVKYFRNYMTDLQADTKTMKDMAAVDTVETNYSKLLASGIIEDTQTYRKGLLKSFFEARELYKQLFTNLYFTRNFRYSQELQQLKDMFMSIKRSSDDKTKVANQIENQLIGYIVQNHHPIFKKRSFESLMVGENSLPKKIQKILTDPTHPLYDNYTIQNMYVELNNTVDELTDSKVDNVRIYEKNLPVIALNDIYELFQELPVDLQDDFVALHFYQTGTNPSPYNLSNILPVDSVFEVLEESIKLADTMNWNDFVIKFQTNNTEHLPTSNYQASVNKFNYYLDWNYKTGESVLRKTTRSVYGMSATGQQVPKEGSQYHKVYNRGITNVDFTDPVVDIVEEDIVKDTEPEIESVSEPLIDNKEVADILEVADTEWMNDEEANAALSAINNNQIEITCKN